MEDGNWKMGNGKCKRECEWEMEIEKYFGPVNDLDGMTADPENTDEDTYEDDEQKTDQQIQAEAILNALKDQEKINQKRQIKKARSRKMEKDW